VRHYPLSLLSDTRGSAAIASPFAIGVSGVPGAVLRKGTSFRNNVRMIIATLTPINTKNPVCRPSASANLPSHFFMREHHFCNGTLYRPQRSERRFLRVGQASNPGDVHPLVEPVSHPVHALACPYIPAENRSVLTCAQHHPPIGAKDH